MSWDEKSHDEALARALKWFDSGDLSTEKAEKEAAEEGSAQALVESYLETLGALPLALEPVEPPAEIRTNLLKAITSSPEMPRTTQKEASATAEESAPASPMGPASSGPASSGPASSATRPPEGTVTPFRRPSGSRPTHRSSWASALAAALSVGVLGLAFYALQLNQRLDSQEKSLAELTHAVLVGHLEAEATAAAHHLGDFQERFPAVQVSRSKLFPLRGVDQSSLRGAMFVCAKHQQWYVNLRGLAPAEADQEYRLWFLTDTGPVAVGPIQIQSDQPYEVSAQRMPSGTQGVLVSLESRGQATSQPAGDIVLEGKTSIEI
ncbi:MAG: anti-sigma factor [Deltaproteobacteria bacterium]|nr:anti-sigma factor [Deltaproteobacteria bacterium]